MFFKRLLFQVSLIFSMVVGAQSIFNHEVLAEMNEKSSKQVVLIGASIGNGWKFPELPNRKNISGFELEFIPVFDSFDKTPALEKVFKKEKTPDVVIIKECSVYFPGQIDAYKSKIMEWTSKLKEKGIKPVLATSVPSGKPDSIAYDLKQMVKSVLGKPKKIDQLTEYNNWLRSFASDNNIVVLDFEKALRISDDNRYLNPKYDRGDYTHLNSEAYNVLDDVAEDFLAKIK